MGDRNNTFTIRPFGGGSGRKLPVPDERVLRDMSLTDLEDLVHKIHTVIVRKRKMDTWGYHRKSVYEKLTKLLEGKTTTSGLLLTTEVIEKLEPKDLQFIELGDHDLEIKVYAALKPFRDKDGKLKV